MATMSRNLRRQDTQRELTEAASKIAQIQKLNDSMVFAGPNGLINN